MEHIIPQALVKKLLSEFNTTKDVCKKCNNDLGRYVDGKFIKSYFYGHYNALGSYEYLDIKKVTYAPLIYWGKLSDMAIQDDMITELWESPCGGRILHIHKKSPGEFDGYAGGDPKIIRKDPGIAIFINANDDQEKIILGLRSFVKNFKGARRYLANIKFNDSKGHKIVGELPDEYISNVIKDFFRICPIEKNGQLVIPEATIDNDPDNRLLAKIGIGLAYNIWGDSYLNTQSYKNLFNILWNKPVDCNNFIFVNFQEGNKLKLYEDFSWKGGIVVTFDKFDGKILLFLNIYEHLTATEIYSEIVDGKTDKFDKYLDKVSIIIPIINEFVEVSRFDFLFYKKRAKRIPVLEDLDSKRTSYRAYG
jgi:hypothetical protein